MLCASSSAQIVTEGAELSSCLRPQSPNREEFSDRREDGGDSGVLALYEVKLWKSVVNPCVDLDSEVSLGEDGVTVLIQKWGVTLQPLV